MRSRFPDLSPRQFYDLIVKQSSIWVVGIVLKTKNAKKWYHQMVGGVMYTNSIEGLASAFISHLAVIEPAHDEFDYPESSPLITKQAYTFSFEDQVFQDTCVDNIKEVMEYVSDTNVGHTLGRNRLGAVSYTHLTLPTICSV